MRRVGQEGEDLVALARAKSPADREKLMLGMASLCEGAETNGMLNSEAVQSMVTDIFMALVVEAERDIRARLAKKIAPATWAPKALVNVLALDDIEIARPIIASSPVLGDAELIRLLVEATIEHQIEVARRPRLSPLVVDAILSQNEPAVLTALACNESAEITPLGMARLVEASRRIAALRSPLARHPGMTNDLAARLYIWVGQSLRSAIVSRFKVDQALLDKALSDAVVEAHDNSEDESQRAVVIERAGDREEMERRLIEKLHGAGQLRSGYLLRALREHRLSLFETALARLGGYTVEQVRLATACDRPELLALACASIGVDRSAFNTILALVRELNGGLPGGGADAARRATYAFGSHHRSVAATAFRHAVTAA
jgi:uncharacterized protein (DUF2336 family)